MARSVDEVELLQEREKGSGRSITLRLHRRGGAMILKVHTTETRYVGKERTALTLCHEALGGMTGVLPRVLLADDGGLPAFIVIENLDGHPLTGMRRVSARTISQVLRLASGFRHIRFPEYGEIAGRYLNVENRRELPSYTGQLLAIWMPRFERSLGAPPLLRRLAGSLDSLASILADGPCLCHSDLTPSNILLRGPRVAVIDFDNAFAYVPDFDVTKLYVELRHGGMEIPRRDYCRIAADAYDVRPSELLEALHRFAWIVLLRHASWCIEHHAEREAADLLTFLANFYR